VTFVISFISVVFLIRQIAGNHCLYRKRRTTVKLYWPLFAVGKKIKIVLWMKKKIPQTKPKLYSPTKNYCVIIFFKEMQKRRSRIFDTKNKDFFPYSRPANYFKKFVWMLYWAIKQHDYESQTIMNMNH
jgi:hypothetical protein